MVESKEYKKWRDLYYQCDNESIESIYVHMHGALLSILYKRFRDKRRVINGHTAKDIIHEVFHFFLDFPTNKKSERILLKKQKMPPDKRIDFLIINKVNNKFSSIYRTHSNRKTINVEKDLDFSIPLFDDTIEYEAIIQKINLLLEEKSTPKRNIKGVFKLWIQKNSNKVIATELGYSETKVSLILKNNIRPLLKDLKIKLL